MAEGLRSLDVLAQVRSLEEFKMETEVTKDVIKHIDMLINIEEKDKNTLETFIQLLEKKVQELLLPPNFTKFHQNLHQLRAYVLPSLLTKLGDESKIPSSCCTDFILWQCCIDILLKQELTVSKDRTLSSPKPRILSHVEQNAVRYTAGFVIRNVVGKWKHDIAVMECLNGLLHNKADVDLLNKEDSSEHWLKTTDRGGLCHITDLAFELFVEIEVFTYEQLSQLEHVNLDELYASTCKDQDIIRIWSECTLDIEEIAKSTTLLLDIVQAWVKIRGPSTANMAMEKYKKKKNDTAKKKATRVELRRTNT